MKPAKTKLKKFRKVTRYQHHRSDGLTWRRNGGSRYQKMIPLAEHHTPH